MSRYSGRTLITQPSATSWGLPAPAGIGVVGGYGVATGGTDLGTRTVSGINYKVLEFTATGTLTVTNAGLFDVLAIGGGGGGGYGNGVNQCGGGGGGGGWLETTIYLSANQSIVIGAGGTQVTEDSSTEGTASTIGNTLGSAVSVGGGGAGISQAVRAHSGGSGGGAARSGTGGAAMGVATGFKGGDASGTTNNGAGGGGAGGVGGNSSGTAGATGGLGRETNTFTGGSSLLKAAGGGGGGTSAGGSGGSSIGGAGGTVNGSAAAANTGSGGGGAGNGTGGGGGSGIVWVRFRI